MTPEERKLYCQKKARDAYSKLTPDQRQARRNRMKEIRNSSMECWVRHAVRAAKSRCSKSGVPFDIRWTDVEIVEFCPITMQPFKLGERNRQSPSLDRVIPEIGYIKGNVRLISWYANAIKRDCTDAEIFTRLSEYLRTQSRADESAK